ncbi:hypothetical protein OSG_eHP18_00225 [environmental Halophage eHP-18]|nr:hypothetical protein OSG_eHP17_00135 [environmental Halophage eHP-17]AFH22202.1 hypothetical protein OSG_eHP18_00225 [environmental Halophage eHP-18]AFH22730.1 hypothetical protein OSG_eHP33_00135 [environmental Halophage eHP-33]
MSDRSVGKFDQIIEAMDYEMVDNGVLELPAATPAVFAYKNKPELEFTTLENELSEHDFVTVDSSVRYTDDGEFYFRTKVLTDHMTELIVKGGMGWVRIFPGGDRTDVYEISRVVHAIEAAVNTEILFQGSTDPLCEQ